MRKTRLLGLLFILWVIYSCDKEPYHYPSVVTNFAELETDNDCRIQCIRTDDGGIYIPGKETWFKDSTPDSIYRIHCTYLLDNDQDNRISIYSINSVIAPTPVSPEYFKNGIKTDPVHITSVWQSGKYINFHLQVLSQGGSQSFHFVVQDMKENTSGKKNCNLTLYHSQEEDPEAYTRDAFLSCPLHNLGLTRGDSILVTIHTYQEDEVFRFCKK